MLRHKVITTLLSDGSVTAVFTRILDGVNSSYVEPLCYTCFETIVAVLGLISTGPCLNSGFCIVLVD